MLKQLKMVKRNKNALQTEQHATEQTRILNPLIMHQGESQHRSQKQTECWTKTS